MSQFYLARQTLCALRFWVGCPPTVGPGARLVSHNYQLEHGALCKCHNNFAKCDKLQLPAVSYPVVRVRVRVSARGGVRRTLTVDAGPQIRPYIAYDVTQLHLYGTHTLVRL